MASNYRYCSVPESTRGFPVAALLTLLVQNSQRFRSGSAALRRGKRLVDEFAKLKAGDSWKLAREDWTELRDECREPNGGEFPAVPVNDITGSPKTIRLTWEWLPLCDMIEDASDEEPVSDEPEPEPESQAEEEPKAAE